MELDTYGKKSPRPTPQPLAAAGEMADETMFMLNVDDNGPVAVVVVLVYPDV